MSRMEQIDMTTATQTGLSPEFEADSDIQLWLKMGRAAFFFCLWSSMALPIALIYYARF